MSDDTVNGADGGAPAKPAAAPTDAQRGAARPAPVQITAQYVKDLSFENPNAPQSLLPGASAPSVTVNVDVRTRQIADTVYEVTLNIRADAKAGERQAFLVELSYAGLVNITGVPKEQTAPILLIEVPRLLFPFARSVVADATRDGGFPPLLVQPIDFTDLFRRQLEALKTRQAAGGGTPAPSETSQA